jgi:glutathione S-transferase
VPRWPLYLDASDTEISTDHVPNPSKVLIILEELNLPYETSWVELEGLKQQPYTDVNPNGRVPAIEDPNHGITLWESGAIVQVSSECPRLVVSYQI